jgi:hypothetical protein
MRLVDQSVVALVELHAVAQQLAEVPPRREVHDAVVGDIERASHPHVNAWRTAEDLYCNRRLRGAGVGRMYRDAARPLQCRKHRVAREEFAVSPAQFSLKAPCSTFTMGPGIWAISRQRFERGNPAFERLLRRYFA